MKPGATVIKPQTDKRFPTTILVGDNDCAVRVEFGALTVFLSNQSNPAIIVVRAEPGDERMQITTRGASDIKNQVEFHLTVP